MRPASFGGGRWPNYFYGRKYREPGHNLKLKRRFIGPLNDPSFTSGAGRRPKRHQENLAANVQRAAQAGGRSDTKKISLQTCSEQRRPAAEATPTDKIKKPTTRVGSFILVPGTGLGLSFAPVRGARCRPPRRLVSASCAATLRLMLLSVASNAKTSAPFKSCHRHERNKKTDHCGPVFLFLTDVVPGTGLEPALPFGTWT